MAHEETADDITTTQLYSYLKDMEKSNDKRFEDGRSRMDGMSTRIDGMSTQLNTVQTNTENVVEILEAGKGFFTVISWVVKAIKPLAVVGASLASLAYFFKHGNWPAG